MLRRSGSVLGLGTLLAIAAAHGAETRLTGETTLRAAPDAGAVLGLLTADAPVAEIERQGEWVRVRVEGWVRSAVLDRGATPLPAAIGGAAASAPATSTATVTASSTATVVAPSTTTLEGTLQLKLGGGLRKKKLVGSGQSVWLLPAGFDLERAGPISPEDETRIADLDAQADRLAKEAERAMHGSNFTEATARNDALMAQRRGVLEQRAAILAGPHRQREAAARRAAIATAVVDARGYFVFPAVAPGAYKLYARLSTDRELDLEWLESVAVGATGVKVELDETRARGLPQGS